MMKTFYKHIFTAMLLLVAVSFGQIAQATVTGLMTFDGFSQSNGNQSLHAWRIQGLLGNDFCTFRNLNIFYRLGVSFKRSLIRALSGSKSAKI